ncbi:tRNA pseudouridine(13) synthase TruD [Ignisphaera sp. 4213-co]|uniref:tRNA pseudouridine(13) synthase TruD n=1 Tax=Ignisphaera cupida TaxID=3050454 RepID=A0ABD4Z4F6_9CREN|nr:tRNA pseudouridine(13) synthase TruD [Ignisphaera sp. 4213-co]MDK6027795.1 tRNA pseudouridine(13) synthase TruD [Ignisphaera sp. 4213-co]
MSFSSKYMLDILLGLHVYTYPSQNNCFNSECVEIRRPEGFVVTEYVNSINLRELFYELQKEGRVAQFSRDDYNNYCAYVVKKRNIDSFSLGQILRKSFRCKDFDLLGLKDAHAIAYQVVLLRGCRDPRPSFKVVYEDASFEAYAWFCDKIKPVLMHDMNEFNIILSIKSSSFLEEFSRTINLLREHNNQFLNFFGYQRFGSRKPVTHILGKALINEDFEKFFNVLCINFGKSPKGFVESLEKLICSLELHDIEKKLGQLLKHVLYGKIIRLFTHAYQAYLFNRILSSIWLSIVETKNIKDAFHVLKKEYRYVPLPGYNTQVNENIRRFLDEVMEIEGITLEKFCLRKLNQLCFSGDYRDSIALATNLNYRYNKNELILTFNLSPGSYATILLREIIRCNPMLYT